jgi:hypothetical protein
VEGREDSWLRVSPKLSASQSAMVETGPTGRAISASAATITAWSNKRR